MDGATCQRANSERACVARRLLGRRLCVLRRGFLSRPFQSKGHSRNSHASSFRPTQRHDAHVVKFKTIGFLTSYGWVLPSLLATYHAYPTGSSSRDVPAHFSSFPPLLAAYSH